MPDLVNCTILPSLSLEIVALRKKNKGEQEYVKERVVKLPTFITNLDMDFPTKLTENKKISDFVRAPEISHNDSVQSCETTNKKSAVISEGSKKVSKKAENVAFICGKISGEVQ